MTERLASPAAARRWCAERRSAGRRIGFVPTMGALHRGHLALVREAAGRDEDVVVSIFVNPLQFDDPADLERYPRDFEGDAALLAGAGCAMVFTGTLAEFFPGRLVDGMLPRDELIEPGAAALGLEDEFRPGHFAGVATIVDVLFDVVEPTRAYFGQKDFQQTLVVRDVARRRGAPEIVVCPTVREDSGLAHSSRNALLSGRERVDALAIPRALAAARERWRAGERDPLELERTMRSVLARTPLALEYAEVRDPERWEAEPFTGPLERAVCLIAARAGAVRLIDNLDLDDDVELPVA